MSAGGKPAAAGLSEPDKGSKERLRLGLQEDLYLRQEDPPVSLRGLQSRLDNDSPEGRALPPPGTAALEPRRSRRDAQGAGREGHGFGGWG